MITLDQLITTLNQARLTHGNTPCSVCICDGARIVHSSELPLVDFHREKDGDFVQIVFNNFESTPKT